MQIIEIVNDCALTGVGIITISNDMTLTSRSLIGLFWNKESREIWIDILFVNFKIKIS